MSGNGALADLGVVVLTHGETELFLSVVADLVEQGVRPEQICVVHNPVLPSDKLSGPGPDGLHAIRMSGNAGYARGMNAGIAWHMDAGASAVWVLTHDVRLRPGAVDAVATSLRSEEFGAIGVVLKNAGTEEVFSTGGTVSALGRVQHSVTPPDIESRYAGIRECAWVDGAAVVYRAAALDEVGLYENDLSMYYEDAELCLRITRAGWKVGVVSSAIAEQSTGGSARPGAVAYLQTRNGLYYRKLVAGRRGQMAGLARTLAMALKSIGLGLAGPKHDRKTERIRALATLAGALAACAGRRGAPPRWLPGQGNTTARGATRDD